jgi:hypothetical protein
VGRDAKKKSHARPSKQNGHNALTEQSVANRASDKKLSLLRHPEQVLLFD